jgi:hypothetical protein
MTAIPDRTAADPQQIIADLERKLDERTSERKGVARNTGDAAYFPDLCCNRQLLKQLKPQIGRDYLCLIEEHSKFVSAGRAEVFGIQT